MRTIKAEIEQYMTALSREGKTLTSRFQFSPEFIGFQGHFPQKKILPGVCQLQLVLFTVEKDIGSAIALKEIILAKYLSPVFPDDEVTCVISDIGEATGEFIVKATLTRKETRISEIKLRVSRE